MAKARVVYTARGQDEKNRMAAEVDHMNEFDRAADAEMFGVPASSLEYKLERRGGYRPSYQASLYIDGKFDSAGGFYRCSCGEVSALWDGQVPMCWHCAEEWIDEGQF